MRRNVLMLQGPIGPFFSRFSKDLENRGFRVHKVNFNGGDALYYRGANAINYTGKLKHWESYLERLLKNRDIGRIYLFGDCRAYHVIAKKVAQRNRVRVFVFEEGYIRPDYITLEESGVNGHSPMLQQSLDYSSVDDSNTPETLPASRVFIRTALYSMAYYLAAAASRKKFRFYQHHRGFAPVSEGFRWIVSAYRKWHYGRKEKDVLSELLPQYENNYFVCPLQVHCDMQVSMHSDYNSIEQFIGDVLSSFAKHAPENKALVVKHHPLDRGYTDYSVLFDNLIGRYGLQGRVFYVHDVCLPTLLKSAEGTVLINSTVGMSSLFHRTPVKTLGRAIYDLPELTSREPLDRFWNNPGSVDPEAFRRFRTYLIHRNQLNGSLYKRLSTIDNRAGLQWTSALYTEHEFISGKSERMPAPGLRVVGGLDVETVPVAAAVGGVDDLDVA